MKEGFTIKHEFVIDRENRKFSFAGKEYASFRSIKISDVPSMFGIYGSTKNSYKQFNEVYGITPTNFKKCFNAIMNDLWVKPIEKHAKRYAFNSTGKINPVALSMIWENLDKIQQCEKDGIENIIPFVCFKSKTPEELKKEYGKSLWKTICKQSMTRNKHIARVPRNVDVNSAVKLPSYFLKMGGNAGIFWNESTVWAFNHGLYNKKAKYALADLRKWMNTYDDTKRMAVQLGKKFNHNWTPDKLNEKHEEFVHAIMLKRYSPKPHEHLVNFKHKVVEHHGFVAELLQSPLAIREEGEAMHHCVGGYAEMVAEDKYLVYSIKKDGQRSSTLGIWKQNGKYEFNQQYGVCNRYVTDEFEKSIGKMIVEKLNEEKQ